MTDTNGYVMLFCFKERQSDNAKYFCAKVLFGYNNKIK